MLVVDVIAVGVLVVALVIGVGRGLCANVGVMLGVVAGAAAAFGLLPIAVPLLPDSGWRGVVAAALAIALLSLGAGIGGTIGHLVRSGVDRTPLRGLERMLGGVVSVAVTALVLSFTAATVTLTASSSVSSAVGSSRVLGVIDDLTPTPLARGMAELRATLLDDGLPRFGALLGPAVVDPVDPIDIDDPELADAAASVARISGTALACGRTVTGSGFVVAPGRIVTNAHVVAGVQAPLVELPSGAATAGVVVYFDPVDDLAVIAVDDLDARPLALAGDVAVGSAAVVQGYPLGGPFATSDAQVVSRGIVAVPDIGGTSSSPRDVYALRTDVRPGNSGGPMLTADGEVAGVVFARGDGGTPRGYAMTTAELGPVAEAASGYVDGVTTGECAG